MTAACSGNIARIAIAHPKTLLKTPDPIRVMQDYPVGVTPAGELRDYGWDNARTVRAAAAKAAGRKELYVQEKGTQHGYECDA